jgi:hypothetical protein
MVKFHDLASEGPEGSRFHLDAHPRFGAKLHVNKSAYTRQFWQEGYCIARNLLSGGYIRPYCELVERSGVGPGGWPGATPYMQHPEILDVCCNLLVADFLGMLFDGQDLGLHLNLTGWVSTERNWHQDQYLNPAQVGSHYVAAWFALDDIHPDSGPFEFAVGSHELPPMSMDKVFERLSPSEQSDPDWPKITEPWVSEACEEIIKDRGYHVRQFIAKRGDVLFWHSRLLHRGSPPKVPGMARKAIIGHYSVVSHRSKIDMPKHARHGDGGYYFLL